MTAPGGPTVEDPPDLGGTATTAPPAGASLWRHHDFRQLWMAETISQVGTQITVIALPILAVVVLSATPFEMGVLITLEFLAFLVIGLPAGAWVDRWRRKRVLISADLIRFAALATLPVAYFLDLLTIGQLYLVALVTGFATVFFDVAYQSYLPSLVAKDQIVDGNAKLEISRAVSQVAGPAMAGGLIKILGAPLMIVFDAVSFLASAAFIGRIRHEEPIHDRSTRRALRVEIGEGLRFVVGHPLLRRIVLCTGTSNFFSTISATLLVLFMIRRLGFSEALVGLVGSAGAIGGLLAAVTTSRIVKVMGEGRSIPLGALAFAPFAACVPIAAVAPMPLIWLIAGTAGVSFGVVLYNVVQVSFRQRLCPPELLGRMNASVRFLVWGTMPIGGLAGGALGTWLGVVPTLWVAAAGALVAALPVVFSPLMSMRDMPAEYDAHA